MFKLFSTLKNTFQKKQAIDAATLGKFKDELIEADLGWRLAEALLAVAEAKKFDSYDAFINEAKITLENLLPVPTSCAFKKPNGDKPHVILLVGTNGVGKTTSAVKIATHYRRTYGVDAVLAAGDTFRAAAVEQLVFWGDKLGFDVIKGKPSSDSAAVAYDAYDYCVSHKKPLLIIDTAGRMQSSDSLMRELRKVMKVLSKQNAALPHEVLMVLDVTLGQAVLGQIDVFNEYVPLTGLIATKLDTLGKGGVLFAACKKTKLPIVMLCKGESESDYALFDAKKFVDGFLG